MGPSPGTPKALVVTLDALGTIYRFKEPVAVQYARMAKVCGFKANFSNNDLNKSFRQAFKSVSEEYPNYGRGTLDSPELWWKTLTDKTFGLVSKGEPVPEDLGSTLYKHFSSGAAYELYPDVRPFMDTISRLRKQFKDPEGRMIICGIITNSDPRVRQVLNCLRLRVGHSKIPSRKQLTRNTIERGLMRMELTTPWTSWYNTSNDFDFLATSYDCDSEKPHDGIFDYARRLVHPIPISRAEQQSSPYSGFVADSFGKLKLTFQYDHEGEKFIWIHIGDDYDKDFIGATEYGHQALWLNREGSDDEKGEYEVASLEDAATVVALMAQQDLER